MIKVGVIGSGAMGSGIAQVAATAGHEVLIFDTNPAAVDRCQQGLLKILNRLAEKGKITDAEAKAIFSRIYFVDQLLSMTDCGLVVEAIVEDIQVKQSVFEQLDTIVKPDAILASNTSSLSITSIASACTKPERVLGIHFFNPVPLMDLVEIIPAVQTAEKTVQQARKIIDQWGKWTVLTKDTPGFIVNRLARPFYSESIRMVEEGLGSYADVDVAMTTLGGFRMGPFTLMDFIGNDINYAVTHSVWTSFFYDPRYKPSFTQKRLVEAKWLGRKTGKGYFDYVDGAPTLSSQLSPNAQQAMVDRVVCLLINEAADALFLQVASKEDLDNAMTKGVNYPKGLLQWADDIGIQEVVDRIDSLYNTYREDRYRCSPLLRKMAKNNQTFHIA